LFVCLGSKDTFSHREFSFTLEDDIYVRYQSYDSRAALEEGIKKATPYKIDIGAIFSVKVGWVWPIITMVVAIDEIRIFIQSGYVTCSIL